MYRSSAQRHSSVTGGRLGLLASSFLLVSAMFALAGCGKGGGKAETGSGTTAEVAATGGATWKIGLMTGTVSQGEDEFRAAQMVAQKYPGRVTHVTYPDNFMQEQETVIAQVAGLAADPEVKVIVIGQAVPGSVAALRKVRETRPDIKVAFIEPHEDPAIVNREADIVVQPDQLARGTSIIEVAHKMGAKNFVHYSFPRHMSMELLARRRDIMKEVAASHGMKFYFVTAPDPMGEGGLPATQQFILEDVPREVANYGKETAFFSTNCGMMDPLIKSVLTTGSYFPEQCCPSPTHGYPTALGIAIPEEHAGDMVYINEQNRATIAKAGMTGHFATWPVPESMLAIRSIVDLLVDSTDGKADYKDMATVQRYLTERAGTPVTVKKYDETTGTSFLVLVDTVYY